MNTYQSYRNLPALAGICSMNEAMKEQLVKLVPLGRTGTAREVAAACVYLASDEAAYVTGHVLRVNGGMYV